MPSTFVEPVVPPGLTRGLGHPFPEPNELPLAPTQPPGPAEYDGPSFVSYLQETLGRERADALIRRILVLDRLPKKEFPEYFPVPFSTDASGDALVKLYDAPAGSRASLHNLIVFPQSDATINPAAPYANAAAFMFLAVGAGESASDLYPGMVAFAPTSSGGPILPGNFFWGTHDAPVVWPGQSLYLAIVGTGTIASLAMQARLKLRRQEHP